MLCSHLSAGVIGASLSEPHIDGKYGAAPGMYVCMYVCMCPSMLWVYPMKYDSQYCRWNTIVKVASISQCNGWRYWSWIPKTASARKKTTKRKTKSQIRDTATERRKIPRKIVVAIQLTTFCSHKMPLSSISNHLLLSLSHNYCQIAKFNSPSKISISSFAKNQLANMHI